MKTMLALLIVLSIMIGIPLLVEYPIAAFVVIAVLWAVALYQFRDTVREIILLVKEVW